MEFRAIAPQQHDHLTIFPIVADSEKPLPYILLVDALERGTLRIEELGSGSVPELTAMNEGAEDVLILDGEQLVGARQNRMTNRSLILPAKSRTTIPVSCMEQSRWHFVSDTFTPAKQHSPSKVRRHARKVEAEYARAYGRVEQSSLRHAQGAVWHEIAGMSDQLGTGRPGGPLDELYRHKKGDIGRWIEAFPAVDDQVGLLAFVRANALGLDVLGDQTLYARLHDRLLRGYIMDALAADRPRRNDNPELELEHRDTGHPSPTDADAFLDRVRTATRIQAPAIGKGNYAVLLDGVLGGELTDGNRLVHLSAFPDPDMDSDEVQGPDHGRERRTGTARHRYQSGPGLASPRRRSHWHRRPGNS